MIYLYGLYCLLKIYRCFKGHFKMQQQRLRHGHCIEDVRKKTHNAHPRQQCLKNINSMNMCFIMLYGLYCVHNDATLIQPGSEKSNVCVAIHPMRVNIYMFDFITIYEIWSNIFDVFGDMKAGSLSMIWSAILSTTTFCPKTALQLYPACP